MQKSANYELIILDLCQAGPAARIAAQAEIAIMDGSREVEVITLSGSLRPCGQGYRKPYRGKPGLSAILRSGSCRFSFREAVKPAA